MVINGINAEQQFGIVLADGAYRELWKLPKAKQGYQYDWGDENGMETDPDAQSVYERLEYSVPLILSAEDENEYWTKLNGFTAFLLSNRYITLDIPERNRRFHLVNLGISNYDEYVEGYNPNLTMNWNLANDNPTEIFTID